MIQGKKESKSMGKKAGLVAITALTPGARRIQLLYYAYAISLIARLRQSGFALRRRRAMAAASYKRAAAVSLMIVVLS